MAEIPIYTKAQIIANVNKLLSDLNPQYTVPVPIEPMIETYGLDIYPVPNFRDSTGNLSAALDNDLCSITIDENTSDGHYRFLLAHEFGHCILHQVYLENLQVTSTDAVAAWRKQLIEIDSFLYKDLERQADLFARYCLMPDGPFQSIKTKAEDKFPQGKTWETLSEPVYQATCEWLADRFRSTTSSVERRLMDCGVQRY